MAPAPPESLERELARMVGSANVLGGSQAAVYAVDGMRPPLAVRPGTLEELSAVVKLLGESGSAVIPRGSGTWSEVGLPPARYDVALLTERLSEIVEYEPDDLTAGVQAGVRFSALQEELRAHRQWLALDPPGARTATVGGVFAGARVGPRRVSTGAPRDRVLGMTAVLADGTVAKTGGRVVKNVSGYDLHRLYTGSCGSLAVLARIHVRLLALPEKRRTLLAVVASASEAGELLAVLRAANLEPCALELLDGSAIRATAARDSSLPWRASVSVDSWTVAALFEGDLELVEEHSRRAQELVAGRRPIALDGPASDEFWEAVSDLSAPRGSALAPDGRGHLMAQVCVLPDQVAGLAERWKSGLFEDRLAVHLHAHAASGHLYVRVAGASLEALAASWTQALEDLEERQVEATAQLLDVPTALKTRIPLWHGSSGPLPLMRSLKQSFDPRGVLSPGRMEFER